MLTTHVEQLNETTRAELEPKLRDHWEKLALDRDKPAAMHDPDWNTYFQLQAQGQLLFISLRDGGKLVGYWFCFIRSGLHVKNCLTGQLDIWNIDPEYENHPKAAVKLMKHVEIEFSRRGVKRGVLGEKIHKPCGKLYQLFGYAQIETYYSKWYGD